MAEGAEAAARFRVYGRVQGVGFRYSARDRARKLCLKGYVRNCADGSVELFAEGDRLQLEKLALWLEQGPPMARVERVEKTPVKPGGKQSGFSITH